MIYRGNQNMFTSDVKTKTRVSIEREQGPNKHETTSGRRYSQTNVMF